MKKGINILLSILMMEKVIGYKSIIILLLMIFGPMLELFSQNGIYGTQNICFDEEYTYTFLIDDSGTDCKLLSMDWITVGAKSKVVDGNSIKVVWDRNFDKDYFIHALPQFYDPGPPAGSCIGDEPSYNGSLQIYPKSKLTGDLSTLIIKDSLGDSPSSLSMCEGESYWLSTNTITNEIGDPKIYYEWYYYNSNNVIDPFNGERGSGLEPGPGPLPSDSWKLLKKTNVPEAEIQLDNLGLNPGSPIKFQVKVKSICISDFKESGIISRDLKYCFSGVETDVINPTCYDSTNAKIKIWNISDPKNCVTYSSADASHNMITFTVSRFVRAQFIGTNPENSDHYTCNGSDAASAGSNKPRRINGESGFFCPAGYTANRQIPYPASDTIVLDESNCGIEDTINNYPIGIKYGYYEIQIENPLFSPYVFYSDSIAAPDTFFLHSALGAKSYGNSSFGFYDVSSPNATNGSIDLDISGGTSPYKYNGVNLTKGSNGKYRITGFSKGTKEITISDKNNCTSNPVKQIVNLIAPEELQVTKTAQDNVSCNNQDTGTKNDGAINFKIEKGIGPYYTELLNSSKTAVYNNKQKDVSNSTEQSFETIEAGTYYLAVRDHDNSTVGKSTLPAYQVDTLQINITEPSRINISRSSYIRPNCKGGKDGALTINAANGTGLFDFNLSKDTISRSASNITSKGFTQLFSGDYSVTVTDENGCSRTSTINLPASAHTLDFQSIDTVRATCNGYNDGQIIVTPTGGTHSGGYHFYRYNGTVDGSSVSFNTSESISSTTSATFSVGEGTHTLFIEDDKDCLHDDYVNKNEYRETAIVRENSLMSLSTTTVNVADKNQSTGRINASLSGGAGKYNWILKHKDGTPESSDITYGSVVVNNLPADTFILQVKDTCNCTNGSATYWENQIIILEPEHTLQFFLDSKTDPSCYGDNTGKYEVHAEGGWDDKSYTYYIKQGTNIDSNTTGKFETLVAGAYELKVKDWMGAQRTILDTLKYPLKLTVQKVDITKVNCYNGSDGSVALQLQGGTYPYYTWTTGQSEEPDTIVTGLNVGTGTLTKDYTIFYKDDHGCSGDTTVTLSQYPEVTFNFIRTVAQTGVANGAIEVEVAGGNKPYSYEWTKKGDATVLDNDTLLSNIFAGEYRLYFEDANACDHEHDTLTLSNKPGPELYNTNHVQPQCNRFSDGQISFYSRQGNPPYKVSLLSDGGTTTIENCTTGTEYTFPGLSAGTYKLAIEDSWGWKGLDTIEIEITDKLPLWHDNLQVKHITQHGGLDSKIELDLYGGNNRYDYVLFDSVGATIRSGRTSGHILLESLYENNYTLVYRDTCGCANTSGLADSIRIENLVIIEPEPLEFTEAVVKPRCNGEDNGYIEIYATGGWYQTEGYTYVKNTTDTTETNSFSGLIAGDYYIEVIDELGVKTGHWVTVDEPDPFQMTGYSVKDVTCYGGSDGSMIFNLEGGTYPYFVKNGIGEWKKDTTILGLSIGNYTVQFKDSMGCTLSDFTRAIVQPDNIEYSINKREAQDTLSNGSLRVSVWGGVPPYQLEWYNEDTTVLLSSTDSLVNIPSNTYFLRITDSHLCEKSQQVFLAMEGSPSIKDSVISAISCHGYNDGQLIFKMKGTHTPYKVWLVQSGDSLMSMENLIDDTEYSFTGLTPGNYILEIRDGWNWKGREFIYINEPERIFIEVQKENVSITGQNTGKIAFTIEGGNKQFQYQLRNELNNEITHTGITGSHLNIENLYAGQYRLYIKDTCGCTNGYGDWFTSEKVVITQPEPLQLVADYVKTPTCNGYNNGSIRVYAKGGEAPSARYQYRINGGSWDYIGKYTGLAAGDYAVGVKDEAGALAETTITLAQPELLEINSVDITTNYCVAQNTTSVQLDVTGGVLPYQYSLNNISWSEGTAINNLSYGNYTIYVKDANNCTVAPESIEIEQTELLSLQITKEPSQIGYSNGMIAAEVTGGKRPYTYNWYNPAGALISTDSILNNAPTGTYRFMVSDANGCSKQQNVVLEAVYGPRLAFHVVTQPEYCKGSADGSAYFCIKDGNPAYEILVYYGSTEVKTFQNINMGDTCKLTGLAAGDYTISMTDQKGWIGSGSFTVTSPEVIQLTLETMIMPTCYGYDDASISVQATGGNGGYSYLWNTGEDTNTITKLKSGSYSITVTDKNNCINTGEYTIQDPELLTVELGEDFAICSGQEYYFWTDVYTTYQWSLDGNVLGTNRSVKVDEEGTYSVVVTDEKGCTANDDVYIEIRNDLLEADFLMPSEANISDTVVVIDISWPDPDQVYWSFSEGIKSINSQDYYEEIIFKSEGILRVSLVSTKGACIDSLSKYINITGGSGKMGEEAKLGAQETMIKSFAVYPNPSTGEFSVKVELREVSQAEIRLIKMDNQMLVNQQKSNGSDAYEFEYNLGHISRGVYILRLEVRGEVKTKKLFIVN